MLNVIIMRGIPGCGKSSHVEEQVRLHFPRVRVVSADHFFGADYAKNFDPQKLPQAHKECLAEYMRVLDLWPRFEGKDHYLFVDNTNIAAWEIAAYYRMAEITNNTTVKILTIACPVEIAIARNVHKVPEEVIRKMASRMETEFIPPWWSRETIQAVVLPAAAATVTTTPLAMPEASSITDRLKAFKGRQPNTLIVFRVGDFCELYNSDAEAAAKILELVVTTGIDQTNGERCLMTFFHHHSLERYLHTLVAAGKRVAIAEQKT